MGCLSWSFILFLLRHKITIFYGEQVREEVPQVTKWDNKPSHGKQLAGKQQKCSLSQQKYFSASKLMFFYHLEVNLFKF